MSQQFIIKLNEQGPQGAQGERGETGATGNGINYIDKTSTAGIVDTYTIYYTNGNTSTFEVTNGNSIDTIEKTSTVGIVDTYTITMVDGSTHTFTVTNGTSISSIEKTSTVGLTDTYTITLTNGDTSTFTVTNGNGIASINKTATSGLTDTYTITFTNGSTMDFDIKNGKSIVSVTGPTTLGLVDTYTINFNDSTSTTFNVTNGNGITNIEKTGSTGLIDTYTISMSNGSYETFTVTNGEKGDKGDIGVGVVGITKTSTTGLEDTYTMSYSDGRSSTFVVTNGNGIEDIELLSTEGLTNNYRINFDNGTYFDYSLDNAKSIVSISKIMTTGLVDTYRITFNDGSNFQFPVTNGNGISGITLLSWEGLDKTYRMTFTNGTYFDFIVSNGAEGQAEWGGISGVLSNQHDLQDALDAKAEVSQTHALKAYSDNGELLTDAEGLADVKNYAHSTFDVSKFTVTGSPVITNDGIASGFSSSDYIANANNITINADDDIYILSPVIEFSALNSTQQSIFSMYDTNSDSNALQFRSTNDNKLILFWKDNSGTDIIRYTTSSTVSTDVKYQMLATRKAGVYNLYYRELGGAWVNAGTNSSASFSGVYAIKFGVALHNNQLPLTVGSVDLKYFEFVLNNGVIANGNITGIDTIKPDDYTVEGTPTISADGVFTSTTVNGSNYVQISNLTPTNDLRIESEFKFSGGTYEGFLINNNTSTSSGMYVGEWGVTWALFGASNLGGRYYLQDGHSYELYLEWKSDGTTELGIKRDDVSSYSTSTGTWTGSLPTVFIFGYRYNNNGVAIFDLNRIKVYSSDNLICQPCLKIPYTLSRTGSKVVNSVYRDRVNDMASQFGHANYYTLSDTDFTLPQVELYGLIGDKRLVKSYYNGLTYWELYSNRRLEQGGTCESGVEYTFTRPFVDANYVLTIPYSSKTATTFIPSATGDFIAKGQGTL